jgi:OPA family glycerol-3-phosphate transporter-like MFS transporter 1/2
MVNKLRVLQFFIFVLVWVVYASTYLIRKPLGVIKGLMAEDLHLSKVQLGWMDTAMLLPYAVLQVIFGPIGDKLGPRKTVGICLFLTGLSLMSFGTWDSYPMLLLLLFISGAAQAPCWPACCKFLSSWFPDEALNTVFGLISTSAFGGSIIATAIAVYLQKTYSWRFVFFPPSFLVLFLAILAWLFMKLPSELHITIQGKESNETKKQNTNYTLCELWKIASVAEMAVSMMCLKLVRYSMYLWLPIYLSQSLNYSPEQAGLFSLLFDVGAVVGSTILGFIVDRYWRRHQLVPVLVSGFLGTVSFIFFTLTAQWGLSYNSIFMLLAGACVCGPDALLGGSVSVSIGEADGKNAGAAVTGLINGFGSLGAVIEGPLVGFVSETFGWNAMFVLIIVLSTFGSFAVFKALMIQRKQTRMNALLNEIT